MIGGIKFINLGRNPKWVQMNKSQVPGGGGGGGGVLPIMAYKGGSAGQGFLFQASGM